MRFSSKMIGAAKLKVYTKKLANGPRRKSKSNVNNKPQLFKREFEFQGSQYDFIIRLVFVNGGHFAVVFPRNDDRLVELDRKRADEPVDHDLTAVSPSQTQRIHSFFLNSNASRKRAAEHRAKVQRKKRQRKDARVRFAVLVCRTRVASVCMSPIFVGRKQRKNRTRSYCRRSNEKSNWTGEMTMRSGKG